MIAEALGEMPLFSPLELTDLSVSDGSEPKTYLKTLGPVENIDRLASGQPPIEFIGPNGMTVIFGVNGSGKSGYARIAKNLCRAVGSVLPLNGDLTIPEPRPNWTVNLTYSEDGTDTSLVWKKSNEEAKPNCLKNISVFDSKTANVYVDEERGLHYLPLELRLLTELGEVAKEFGDQFDKEATKATEKMVELPTAPDGTTAAALLNRLDASSNDLPSNEDIEAAATFSEANQSELDGLLLQQALTPEAKKQTLLNTQQHLKILKTQLDFFYSALSDQNLQNITALLINLTNKQTIAKAGAASLASDMPLPKVVGTELWRQLFMMAREIATGTFRDADEPAIANGDECVLCQQTLNDDARERLLTFNAIIEGELQKASDAANTAYLAAIGPIQDRDLITADNIKSGLQPYANLSGEHAKRVASLAQIIGDMHSRLAEVRGIIKNRAFENETLYPPMPQNISVDVQTWLTQIDHELPNLDTASANGDRGLSLTQLQELANLEARKNLTANKQNIIKRSETLQQISTLKECWRLCQTELITRQLGSRMAATITDTMTKTYQAELSKLKLDYIKVKVGIRGDRGKQLFRPKVLKLERGKRKLSQILSEGEQRAIALAGFLTEINDNGHAIILDDPVSSLDWERKTAISERLIGEATKRQVIIFTHDFAFANMLKYGCDKGKVNYEIQWINRLNHPTKVAFGVIGVDHAEWDYKSVTQAEDYIQAQLNKLENVNQNSDEYRSSLSDIGRKLRIVWEKAVEEVAFNKVISRYTPEVKVARLEDVKYEASKHSKDYGNGYSAASSFVHAGTTESSSIPSLSALKKNLEDLRKWRTSVTAKKPKNN